MRQPSISDYIRTMENPHGVFRTLGEVGVAKDIYGETELRAGNSAAVFTYVRGERKRFLKCYIRPNPHLREIYAYIERNRPVLLPEVRLLRDELYVHTLSGEEGWTDVVEGEWTEGETLDAVIAGAAKSGNIGLLRKLAAVFDSRNTGSELFGILARAFDDLCCELLSQEWAHGDLKPENIIVRPDGSLALIDCDAVWIPAFAGRRAVELGTPGYRHPARGASHFDKHIDDYPMLLVSAALHALALRPELYAKYNTADNLLLLPAEVVAGNSAACAEMLELFAHAGMAREYRMTETLASPDPAAENIHRYFVPHPSPRTGELVSFVENGKWGFADASGSVVIVPFWDEVLEFRGDRAAVRIAEWWHFIDRAGTVAASGLSHDEMKSSLVGR